MKTLRSTENTACIRLLQVVGTVLGIVVLLSVLAVALTQGKSAVAVQMKSAAPIVEVKSPDVAVQFPVVGVPIAYTFARNQFLRPNCTWWANERYHQLHGVYVPWGGNAGVWASQARGAGWHVSSQPRVGDIVVLGPGVQGAGGLGHVAVVERVLGGGRVTASNMNWGRSPWSVTYIHFHIGYGVSFVHR